MALLDTLDGTLSRVIFHKPSKWNPAGVPYFIGKLSNGVVVKGEMRKPVEYERYRFWGELRPQKGRGANEEAFEFSSYEVIIDKSVDGYARYLAEYVDGIGPAKAKALVEHLGDDTMTILRREPERALEVNGITEAIVANIRRHFDDECKVDPVAYARLIEMFAGHKIPKRVVKDIVDTQGSNAVEWVKENPYALLAYPRIGWETADSFAMTACEYDPKGIERHKAAILEGVERATAEGHTYGRKIEIQSIAVSLIGMGTRDDAWEELIAEYRIIEDTDPDGNVTFTTPALYKAEISIADRIQDLIDAGKPLPFSLATDDLQGEQVDAAKLVEQSPVCILAGPPGTGKSFTAAQFVKVIVESGNFTIRYVAPTGKAAKRAAELLQKYAPRCRVQPTTIHKALGPKPSNAPEGVRGSAAKANRGRSEFGFSHNEDNPMEVDFLFVDEGSMVDVPLFDALLSAVPLGTRVIIIGDQNQLPSVGPGQVLYDMMRAGVPVACLREIRRSTPGRVIQACHNIKDGRNPVPATAINLGEEVGDNWVHIERGNPEDIAATVVELHKVGKTFTDPLWHFQVVTPQRGRLAFACDNLNRMLSAKLNPLNEVERATASDEDGFAPAFRIGDKVVRTKNGPCDELSRFSPGREFKVDWTWDGDEYSIEEGYVVNGDMGIVRDIVIEPRGAFVVVQFNTPDRLVRLPYGEAHIIQAYAMTCHKCQGSGFPFVIVPVHTSTYKELLTREWIYTAISRTEKLLVTVGEFSAIRDAVARKRAGSRRTRLADRLRNRIEIVAEVAVS